VLPYNWDSIVDSLEIMYRQIWRGAEP
jgi:hypothetical protein